MLRDLDETIRALLRDAGGLGRSDGMPEVDISFDIPNKTWSGNLSTRFTINCYLFDIHERRVLREGGWQVEARTTQRPTRRQPPLFFELTYLITAWTKSVEDEHLLLWKVLETLMDHPVIPEEFLRGQLTSYEWPVHTMVGQIEGVLKSPGEFWTALENHLKPSLSYVVTLGRDRVAVATDPPDAPPVLTTGIRLRLPEGTADDGFWITELFGLPPGTSRSSITIAVEERSETFTVGDDGRVRLPGLPPGRYVLRTTLDGTTYRKTVLIAGDVVAVDRRYTDVVRDQHGRGLPGVTVEVEGGTERTTTDADGRFWLELSPGSYILRLWLADQVQRRRITHTDLPYRIRLAVGGTPIGGVGGGQTTFPPQP